MDIYLFDEKYGRFERKESVPFGTDTADVDGKTCDVDPRQICFSGGDLRLYYKKNKANPLTGNLQPLSWERYDGKISGSDIHDIYHDQGTLEGIMSMLGVGGAGSVNKKQWGLIIGIVGVLGLAFYFIYPYITSFMG